MHYLKRTIRLIFNNFFEVQRLYLMQVQFDVIHWQMEVIAEVLCLASVSGNESKFLHDFYSTTLAFFFPCLRPPRGTVRRSGGGNIIVKMNGIPFPLPGRKNWFISDKPCRFSTSLYPM